MSLEKHKITHNPLSHIHLSSFCPPTNWLCFFKFVLPARSTLSVRIPKENSERINWLCFSWLNPHNIYALSLFSYALTLIWPQCKLALFFQITHPDNFRIYLIFPITFLLLPFPKIGFVFSNNLLVTKRHKRHEEINSFIMYCFVFSFQITTYYERPTINYQLIHSTNSKPKKRAYFKKSPLHGGHYSSCVCDM